MPGKKFGPYDVASSVSYILVERHQTRGIPETMVCKILSLCGLAGPDMDPSSRIPIYPRPPRLQLA